MSLFFTKKQLARMQAKVKKDTRLVLDERESLGLSVPQEFAVTCDFYDRPGTFATTKYSPAQHVITIHLFESVFSVLSKDEQVQVERLGEYFESVRHIFADCQDTMVLAVLENPAAAFRKFERQVTEMGRKRFEGYWKRNGIDYELQKAAVRARTKDARDMFSALLPRIEQGFEKADVAASLRHEMDHVDFFAARLVRNYFAVFHQWQKEKTCERRVLEELVRADALMEPRALFFNHVPPNGWKDVDYEVVKKRVGVEFVTVYAERTLAEAVLDVVLAHADGMTQNYAKQLCFPYKNYHVLPEKVDIERVHAVVYEELPYWKKKLVANAVRAIDVMGNAYRDDPSRFKRANKARTFEEFLEKCK